MNKADLAHRRAERRAAYERDCAAVDAAASSRERYAYRSCGQALRDAAEYHQRAASCPAVLPEPDRVDGGMGSRRPERLAEAGRVLGCLEESGLSEAERDVILAHAIGTTQVDGKWGWAWAARRLGCRAEAVYGRVGALQRRAHEALRARNGMIKPMGDDVAEKTESEYLQGMDAILDYITSLGLVVGRTAVRSAMLEGRLRFARVGVWTVCRREWVVAWVEGRA